MKSRQLTILLTFLLALLPTRASAQWWLFPGGKHKSDTTSVTVPDTGITKADTIVFEGTGEFQDSLELASIVEGLPRHEVKLSLILPFNSGEKVNGNFLDFYTGVLMAAQDLSALGYVVDIDVIDSTQPGLEEKMKSLSERDLVIGPVGTEDLNRCVTAAPDTWFISPLEPKAEDFARWCKVIQTPTPAGRLIEDLTAWISEDYTKGDRIVLLQNDQERESEATSRMIDQMNAAGLKYEIAPTASSVTCPTGHTVRFVLTSDNGDYTGNQAREIALMSIQGDKVMLYGTSRIRTASNMDRESLNLCCTHMTINYFIDMMDGETILFSENYRELFHSAPGSFACQGYDVAKYFISMFDRFGPEWSSRLSEAEWEGIQTDFKFSSPEGDKGWTNTATRRILYKPDNTITLLK